MTFLFAPFKNSLVNMYSKNDKDSQIKVTGETFPESLKGEL